jgi:predicted porin
VNQARFMLLSTAAAAVALCAGGAHAQSNVSISGWLDAGIMKKTGGSWQVGTPSRNNIAFAGTEDLGDGMQATFKLSHRFELDTGAVEASDAQVPFWKGEATVGLKGKFGSLRLGRALTPLWDQGWNFDPWYNFDRIASPQWWMFAPDFLSNPQTREYSRLNNGIFYDSPDFSGLSFHLSTGIEKADTDPTRSVGASVNYDANGLSLMLSAERNSQKDQALFIGAAYSFGNLRVMGGYNRVKLDPAGVIFSNAWTNWAGASDPKTTRRSVQLGATYGMGVHTFRAGVGRDFEGSTSFFNTIGSTFANAGTGFSGPSTMASVGYVYALSKRTSLYADLSTTRWDKVDDNGRTSAMGYALGMSHSF